MRSFGRSSLWLGALGPRPGVAAAADPETEWLDVYKKEMRSSAGRA